MKTKIFASVTIAVIGFLVYVYFRPAEMHISRELIINAPPKVLFSYLNNSKKMNEWMPWQDSDPQLKMQYSGPEEGVGSVSSWNSPGKMGEGRAVIIESNPEISVKTKITYIKPMEMSQISEMSLTTASVGTLVRWSVTGQNNFMSRLFCLFINVDKEVGGNFEKGLQKLASLTEKK